MARLLMDATLGDPGYARRYSGYSGVDRLTIDD